MCNCVEGILNDIQNMLPSRMLIQINTRSGFFVMLIWRCNPIMPIPTAPLRG